MRTKTILTLVASTLAALPVLGASPNLLSGGSFDNPDSTKPWQVRSTRVEVNDAMFGWFGIDALGSPDSGSLNVDGPGTISRCVAVTAGQAYDFGARILVTTRGHLKTPTAFLKLSFFSDQQCATQPLAEATTSTASLVGRFTAVSATAQVAPAGAQSAVITIVIPQSADLGVAPGGIPPAIYVDDAFLRLSGQCAPDASTLCFARNTMRARVNVINADGTTSAAQAVQTSPTTGYFALDGVDQPDVTIKTYDFAADAPGSRWFVIGGLTDQKLQITVEDLDGHDVRTYTNAGGQYLEPIVDAFFAP